MEHWSIGVMVPQRSNAQTPRDADNDLFFTEMVRTYAVDSTDSRYSCILYLASCSGFRIQDAGGTGLSQFEVRKSYYTILTSRCTYFVGQISQMPGRLGNLPHKYGTNGIGAFESTVGITITHIFGEPR